jgi:predicted phosphohydrolase
MHVEEAMVDLRWVDALPGNKVFCKGNHDYWWDRARPLRPILPSSIALVEADALDIGKAIVCGTRGWITPDTPGFAPDTDNRIYNRELGRLDRALAAAKSLNTTGKPIIVMIHYPPFIDRRPTEFARRMAAANAAACVYGHLHRPEDWNQATQGVVDQVFYQLSACDYLGFGPVAVRIANEGQHPENAL